MPRRTLVLLSATFILAACSDGVPTSPAVIHGPSFALSDGSDAGNNDTPGFFFLPPIVDQPNATGEFDPNLPSRVEICELDDVVVVETTDCVADPPVPPVRVFSPLDISVDPDKEQYHVGWQTGQDNLDPSKLYRIQVFIGTVLLGFRDVDPVETADEVPKTQQPGIYVFKNGSNIPIKFRIEFNVLCFGDPECASGSATSTDGGTIALESGGVASGGVEISGNSFTTPDGAVAVIVERLPNANCLGGTGTGLPQLDIPQVGDCFRIRTEPELTGPLTAPALVALCDFGPTPGLSAAQLDLLRVHRFNEDPTTPVVEALPNGLSKVCGETRGTFLSTNPIMRFAWQAVRGVLGLPKPLRAADLGLGGFTSSFSRFRWALPSKFEQPLFAGDGQTALVNTAVTIPPAVKVVDVDGDPVNGATVHFERVLGGGAVVPAVDTTGADGIAVVTSWTMGPAAGLNTLDAFGFGISAGSTPFYDTLNVKSDTLDTGTVTFTATACAPGFGSPNEMDGVMDPGEWDCALQQDFPVNLSGGSTTTGTLFWMNDTDPDSLLYLAVRVPRDAADKVNSLRFDFDNNNDGVVAAGDDAIEFDGAEDKFTDEFLTEKCTNRGQSGCGALDTKDNGTSDGSGGFSNDGTFSVYELSHPWDSADDAHDISAVLGGQVSFFLTLRTGKGAQGNTQWLGFRIFHKITISDGSP